MRLKRLAKGCEDAAIDHASLHCVCHLSGSQCAVVNPDLYGCIEQSLFPVPHLLVYRCRCQVLVDFVKALLNDLSYLMDDSLDRIADVQAINARKMDPTKWQELSAQEQSTNESFRASQVR
jgi:hypothetical protein